MAWTFSNSSLFTCTSRAPKVGVLLGQARLERNSINQLRDRTGPGGGFDACLLAQLRLWRR